MYEIVYQKANIDKDNARLGGLCQVSAQYSPAKALNSLSDAVLICFVIWGELAYEDSVGWLISVHDPFL